ncbi:uncharacterized protein LOC128672449 [Plodia interpunctella]|uniref:uncharacterized protein LOC128672449 n=1 Tax=Plodia interpunctella TaxID=58824 RepID=UPI0023689A64|nr:uncharacterized protein LOC128672449 [Plodia interpunctella]
MPTRDRSEFFPCPLVCLSILFIAMTAAVCASCMFGQCHNPRRVSMTQGGILHNRTHVCPMCNVYNTLMHVYQRMFCDENTNLQSPRVSIDVRDRRESRNEVYTKRPSGEIHSLKSPHDIRERIPSHQDFLERKPSVQFEERRSNPTNTMDSKISPRNIAQKITPIETINKKETSPPSRESPPPPIAVSEKKSSQEIKEKPAKEPKSKMFKKGKDQSKTKTDKGRGFGLFKRKSPTIANNCEKCNEKNEICVDSCPKPPSMTSVKTESRGSKKK